MYIKPDYIIVRYILPKINLSYKILFVDETNLDNPKYYRQLSNAEKTALKPYMMEIGGHWSEASQSFVFMHEISPDLVTQAIDKQNSGIKTSDEHKYKEEWQSYFTPQKLAAEMHELANITTNDIVLDPSAGVGNLVDGLKVPKKNIFLVEPNPEFCEELRKKGYQNVINSTFEEAIEMGLLPPSITKIIMNPPFTKQIDLVHVSLAHDIISEGGTIVSVVGNNSLFEKSPKSKILKAFEDICVNAEESKVIPLPEGTFEESGTICDTNLVFLIKGKKIDNEYKQTLE